MAGSKRERPPGSGYWELKVYAGVDPVTGRSRYVYDHFKGGARAAERALEKLVAKVRADRAPATEGTLGYLLTHWMRQIERDRSPETAAGYWLHIDNVWMPRLGDVKLAKLTTAQLQGVVDDEAARVITKGARKDRTLSPDTVEREFAVVRRALNEAVRMGWLDRSPADNVVLPAKGYEDDDDPPTVAELLEILTVADQRDPSLGMLLRVSSATGVRRGELAGMRWRDVDFDRGRIMVVKNVVVKKRRKRQDGEHRPPAPRALVVKDTKNHQRRPVSIDQATVTLLRSLKDYVDDVAARETPDGRLVRDAFVFSREPDSAQPIRPPWITASFKEAAVAAGYPRVHLHQLRHLNASLQLAAGVPLAVVSKRLGHRNQSTTLGFYSHVLDGDEAAAEILGQLLAGAHEQQPGPEPAAAEVIELKDRRAGS
jgi:integrase